MKTIVFSHANGFPAGTYRQLFEAWRAAGFTVHAVEKFGHDPRWDGGDAVHPLMVKSERYEDMRKITNPGERIV